LFQRVRCSASRRRRSSRARVSACSPLGTVAPPDHVVSVHPTPVASLSELRHRGFRIPSHTTVFTDFVAHTQWIYPSVERYCVPAEEIARDLMARGVARERVTVTGIPVAAEFAHAAERAQGRLALGLSPRPPTIYSATSATYSTTATWLRAFPSPPASSRAPAVT
jgi:processive 1,2-diacylglycerol beta-glucosyltransferase